MLWLDNNLEHVQCIPHPTATYLLGDFRNSSTGYTLDQVGGMSTSKSSHFHVVHIFVRMKDLVLIYFRFLL